MNFSPAGDYDIFPQEDDPWSTSGVDLHRTPTRRLSADSLISDATSLGSMLDNTTLLSPAMSVSTTLGDSPPASAPGSVSLSTGGAGGKMDKACKACRSRKVKCDRQWPRCGRCTSKQEECSFSKLVLAAPTLDTNNTDADVRISALEIRIAQLEAMNSRPSSFSPPRPIQLDRSPSVVDTVQRAFPFNAEATALLRDFFAQQAYAAQPDGSDTSYQSRYQSHYQPSGDHSSVFIDLGTKSWDWKLATRALAKALSHHLIESFFFCCCSYLPVFDSFHPRLRYYSENLDDLNITDKIAVAAFTSLGARSSPHSAILGIPTLDPEVAHPNLSGVIPAGSRRESACRIIHKQTISLYHESEIAEDPSVEHLETILVLTQMAIFAEIRPRKSVVLVRVALTMLKDLFYVESISDARRDDAIRRLGVPLFTADAVIAAYARRPPQVTRADVDTFFAPAVDLHIPTFGVSTLAAILDPILSAHITHASISHATTIVSCWLAECQREFGRISTPRAIPMYLLGDEIRRLWLAIDEVHAGCRAIQQKLVSLSYRPDGCSSTECSDLHLRYDTRLDRDLMDVSWLIHSLITQHFVGRDPEAESLHAESTRRVRKTLKLIAFYSQLFLSSRDLHMTYHLIWQLELLPNWIKLAVQRFEEPGGPENVDLELSETELNWLSRGLTIAAFYHPIAETRLAEFQHARRPPRVTPSPGPGSLARPSVVR